MFPSTRRTAPLHIWHFINSSICLPTTPPSVLRCLLTPFFFLVVRQLAAIGHKLGDLEISDKLLIWLHQSWVPVRTVLTLRKKTEKPEIKLITSMLKQFEANESLVAAPRLPIKAEESEPSLAESALYAKS